MRNFLPKYFLVILALIFTTYGCSTTKISRTIEIKSTVNPFLFYYEGVISRIYGNFPEAIESLKKSISADSTNSAPYYELALCYLHLNQDQKSIENLERAIALEPTNEHYLKLIVSLYIKNNLIEQALRAQKVLVSIDSISVTNQLQLGLLYSQLSKFDSAIHVFNSLSHHQGFIPKVSESLARIYYEKDSLHQALTQVSQLVEKIPDNPFYLLFLSDIQFNLGYDSIGFTNLYRALDLGTDLNFTYLELYKRYMEQGNIPKGISMLERIIVNDNVEVSDKVLLFYQLVQGTQNNNSFRSHVDTLMFSLLNEHSNDTIVNDFAFEYYFRNQNFNAARVVLNNLIKLEPNSVKRWQILISMEFSVNNYANAAILSLRAIERFPNHYIFYVYASHSYQSLDIYGEAFSILYRGYRNVKTRTEKSEILGSLGDLYYNQNNKQLAFKSYRKSIRYNNLNARILNNYSYYLSLEKMNLDKALEMSTKAVNLEPSNSTYIDTKGWVLFQMGRYEEARDVLRSAVSKNGSSNPVILEHYADALYKTGNKDSAYIYWLKAREAGKGSEHLEEKIKLKRYVP